MAAPDDDKANDRRPPSNPCDNPFTTFQRFVDERMSAMLQSLVGLPSAFRDPQAWPSNDPYGRWRGGLLDLPPQTADEVVCDFIFDSPYSPLQIENDPHLKIFGSQWREAFADLMDAAEGRQMASTPRRLGREEWFSNHIAQWTKSVEQHMKEQSDVSKLLAAFGASNPIGPLRALDRAYEEAREMFSLGDRGEFEDREDANDREPDTELDMYDRWSDRAGDNVTGSPAQPSSRLLLPPEQQQSKPPQPSSRPSLISTLTRTETVTMPDGSVRTRRVLKKRFADGTEERNESEEVSAPKSERSQGLQENTWKEQPRMEEKQDSSKPDDEKKRGWFWS